MRFKNHESIEVFFCPICKDRECEDLSWMVQKDVLDHILQRVRKPITGIVNLNDDMSYKTHGIHKTVYSRIIFLVKEDKTCTVHLTKHHLNVNVS